MRNMEAVVTLMITITIIRIVTTITMGHILFECPLCFRTAQSGIFLHTHEARKSCAAKVAVLETRRYFGSVTDGP